MRATVLAVGLLPVGVWHGPTWAQGSIEERLQNMEQRIRYLEERLDATMAAMATLMKSAEGGEAYDQMIGEGNKAGNARVQAAIDALSTQTRSIEKVVASLGLAKIAFEGSDSLDNPAAVFE